ncbi:MAG TPA: hypothetical protein VF121_02170, partial [Thermoanaerobaculia bacterium]|nr:hypothetical protein [Thermoanaerobaculia bacterium]
LANTGFARWLAGTSGPGGVAVVVRLYVDGPEGRRDLLGDRRWLPLPRDLAPGERRRLRLRLANAGPARWLAGTSGPGGVAVVVRLYVEGPEGRRDLLGDRRWLPLPRDLAAGEAAVLETEVRRPAGPARLWVEPHVFQGLDGRGFSELGGPWWAREI